MWSILNGRQDTGVFVNMGFSFIRMSDRGPGSSQVRHFSFWRRRITETQARLKRTDAPRKALLQALPEWALSTSFLKRSSQAKVRTGLERYLRHKEFK